MDLGYTSISSFPGNMFSQLSNVRTLYLNGNQFQNIPTEIRAMPLTHLNMNANPIDHLDNESFVGLDRLQQLVISGMPNLTDIGSGTFVPLKTLITLHMAHNPTLSNIHFDAFRDHMTNQLSLRQVRNRYIGSVKLANDFTVFIFNDFYTVNDKRQQSQQCRFETISLEKTRLVRR